MLKTILQSLNADIFAEVWVGKAKRAGTHQKLKRNAVVQEDSIMPPETVPSEIINLRLVTIEELHGTPSTTRERFHE